MKTPEQIKAETPFSITTTDNAIYRALIDIKCLIKAGDMGDDDFVTIPKDTLLRIADCELDEDGFTMVRYNPNDNEEYDFSIANKYLEYVSGDLGTKIQ
jgi:hypothetical protein